jgi:hypothetical protein
MKLRLKTLRRSHRKEKKWDAVFVKGDKEYAVPFGARGYSDFTKHKNVTRKARYLKRHSGMGEHWQKPDTPGALAKWILWGPTTSLTKNTALFRKRFNL